MASGWKTGRLPALTSPIAFTTRVPCGDFFDVRDDALRAHATQIDPYGWWFRVPLSILSVRSGPRKTTSSCAAWSTPEIPEDDLFAGIDARVGGMRR